MVLSLVFKFMHVPNYVEKGSFLQETKNFFSDFCFKITDKDVGKTVFSHFNMWKTGISTKNVTPLAHVYNHQDN